VKGKKISRNLANLLSILRSNSHVLDSEYKVARIGVFGSRARGDSQPRSDVDILVQFKEPVGLFLFSGLKQFLESIFGLDVDLATPNALRDEFREDVLREVAYA
jgi:predicted nucleotidyltransferase